MTNLDRCANPSCRTSVDLDWDAESCEGGHVITCIACDPNQACREGCGERRTA